MNVQLNPISTPEVVKVDPQRAARDLGKLLRQTPEYEAFLKAYKAVNKDLTVQNINAKMRSHQSALQWGNDDHGKHAAAMAHLQEEMENLSIIKEYRQQEKAVQQLFRAVDEIISREAGVPFAVNAKRGGCCG